MIDFCQKHDVRIVFGYMQVLGRATKNIELALDSDQIVKFNKNIIENHPNIVLPLMFSHTPCPLDIDTEPLSFRVASDGRVFPCASFHEDFFCIGNIYDNTLSDIINSDKFKSIQNWIHERKKIMSNNQCKNCYVSNLCQGSCPAASYYEMGDVNIPVHRLCEASKKFNYYMLPKLLNNIKLQERG